MMWKGKKQVWAGFLAACVLLLAGCGRTEMEEQQGNTLVNQGAEAVWYYQRRPIDTPVYAQGFYGWIMGSNMTEAGLYYLFQPRSGLDQTLKLYRLPVTELFCEDVLSGNYAAVHPVTLTQELPVPESVKTGISSVITEYCWRFFQGQDGDLYYLTFDREQEKNYLYHIDAEGRELARTDVTEALRDMQPVTQMREGYLENSSCSADDEGRVYLTDQGMDKLWVLDSQGGLLMQLSLPEKTQQLTVYQDGEVYLITGRDAESRIERLDIQSGSIENVMDMPQTTGVGAFVPGSRLLYRDHRGLYICDPQQGSAELTVLWDELEISGKNILQAREMPTGKIYVWGDDYVLTQASQIPVTDIPAQKQTVTVAALGTFADVLNPIVAEFNEHNAYYEAVVVEYDYFEGPQKLEMELATGKAPDLLDTRLLYQEKLVDKGFLADLAPYLEDGKGIERQDLVEAVLRCNTIDGVLTCIPEGFGLEVLVGKPQLLGDTPGWTIEEYTAYIQENRGLEIMGSNRYAYNSNQSGHAIVELPMYGDIAHWADYRQGEARFDREDFRTLLELAGDYKVTQPAVELWAAAEVQEGRMLTYVAALWDMQSYLLLNAALQQEIVYKGYPADNGSPVYSLATSGGYAINVSSQVQDGAWALIEFMLTLTNSSLERGFAVSTAEFSTLESQFDYQMRQSMVKEYQRDPVYYQILYDEEGQPIEVSKYKSYDRNGNVIAECLAARQEDVESLRQLIDAATLSSGNTADSLYQIASEEIGTYLGGQRSAEETISIIQSRVQLYLDENK